MQKYHDEPKQYKGYLKSALEDELTTFLPDYPTQGHQVTVHQLLNHTSGIKSMTDPDLGDTWRRLDATHDEVVDRFSGEPFNFAPGEEYRYNNSGYYLLGVIVERVSGETYADFLREQVWNPLGMRETHYLYNSPIIKNRAEGYKVSEGTLLNDDPLSMHVPFSAGALGSSVVDLLTWQRALHEHRLMGEESYQKMITPGILNDGSPLTYGYGLQLGSLEEHRTISHGGGINGFTSVLSHYPDDELTIAVLCNTPTDMGRIERALARVVLGIPNPVVTDLALPEAQLAPYTGSYQLGPLQLRVYVEDGTLMSQATGQPAFRLRPQGDHVFIPTFDDEVTLTFQMEDGRVGGVVLLQGGQEIHGGRVE